MKKCIHGLIFVILICLMAGCVFTERRIVHVLSTPWIITQVVTATPLPDLHSMATKTPDSSDGPLAIATALRTVPTQRPTRTSSPSPTVTPTPSRTPTSTSFFLLEPPQQVCPDTYVSFLQVGMAAFISPSPESNIIRKDPGLSGEDALMRLHPGEMVLILDGPECLDEMVWWKVQSILNPNKRGWTSEGGNGEYWVIPARGSPTPSSLGSGPTPIPDYTPGQGMAVLMGESSYELLILPGGWQAYSIGPSADEWGYLVDITPLQPAVIGAYLEYKILPEYSAGQWVDVLWLRATGIRDYLPVRLDLIPTKNWRPAYEANVRLTPGDWMGFGMFSNGEGCGGVLDISPYGNQVSSGAYIANTRVQPEFPGEWIQVIRVQLSSEAASQQAWLRYYTPGPQAKEIFREEATLLGGVWSERMIAESQASQGYLVEVIPLEDSDNEVAFSVVRPEFNGEDWLDVLRIFVPESRPPLEALLRVLAVQVP